MNLQKIEDEALHLPKDERAKLLQKLVLSFDFPDPAELKEEWLAEAARRSKELDEGVAQPILGSEVLRKARTLIK